MSAKIVVRLVYRSGQDRMSNSNAHAYALECGFDEKRNGKEKGGMVCVNFSDLNELPSALEALGELWATHRRNCERNTPRAESRLLLPAGH